MREKSNFAHSTHNQLRTLETPRGAFPLIIHEQIRHEMYESAAIYKKPYIEHMSESYMSESRADGSGCVVHGTYESAALYIKPYIAHMSELYMTHMSGS